MSRYIAPITDRAASDITNQTSKAFFNVVDWQRIYNNAQVAKAIVDFLLSIDVTFNAVSEVTISTIPTVTEVNTLLANIERIRVASGLPTINGISEILANWQEGPAADAPDYINVNEWEQIVDALVNGLPAIFNYRIHCGVGTSGMIRFYQHRFRVDVVWVADSVSPVRRARTGIATANTSLTWNNGFRRYD